MWGGVFRINGESGPPRENSVINATYKKSSRNRQLKLLKAEVIYPRVYNNSVIIIIIIIIITIIIIIKVFSKIREQHTRKSRS